MNKGILCNKGLNKFYKGLKRGGEIFRFEGFNGGVGGGGWGEGRKRRKKRKKKVICKGVNTIGICGLQGHCPKIKDTAYTVFQRL